MSTKNRPAEDDTGSTKEVAVRVTGSHDLNSKEITDQDRAEMQKSLENAGYKAKDAVTE
jgi:uncharacterized protein YjbJ (UPF0337 family)